MLVRYWIRLGWDIFLNGLIGITILVGIVLGLTAVVMGLGYGISYFRKGEGAKAVGVWIVAKKGLYCPEVEFVEEDAPCLNSDS